MSLPLVFEPEVRGEIDDAYAWFEKQRPGLGEEFLSEVEAVLDRTRKDPELHAKIHGDVRRALVRRFTYAVYYRVKPQHIELITVHHSKRDPKLWQGRG